MDLANTCKYRTHGCVNHSISHENTTDKRSSTVWSKYIHAAAAALNTLERLCKDLWLQTNLLPQ